jgi:antitoxin HicB
MASRNCNHSKENSHLASSFDSWLEQEGIREEVTAAAIKAVIARQLANEMKKKKITKQRMALLMKTSRTQIDRLLDPDNGSHDREPPARRQDRGTRVAAALA